MMSDDIPSDTSTTPQTLDTPVAIPRERRRSKRNYWAHTAPEEYVQYPAFDPMPYLTEARLIQRAQAGDLDARNQVWAQNARLALAVVNEFKIPPHLMADAIQEGVLGLLRAIEKYDVDRLNAFSTYAWYWVWQAVQRFIPKQRYFVRIPPHLLPEIYHYLNSGTPPDKADDEERISGLARVIQPLPLHLVPKSEHPETHDAEPRHDFPGFQEEIHKHLRDREFEILCHRFGLINGESKTLAQVAVLYGRTRERVRQIEARALKRLRKHLPIRYRQHFLFDDQKNSEVSVGVVEPSNAAADAVPVGHVVAGDRPAKFAPKLPKYDLPPLRHISSQEAEAILLEIFKDFSFLEANSLIYHYGLMHAPKLPLSEIGEMLEVHHRRVWWLIRRGRKKLLAKLRTYRYFEFVELRRHIKADPIARQAAPPKRFD